MYYYNNYVYCHAIPDIKAMFHHTGKNIVAFLIEAPKIKDGRHFVGMPYIKYFIFFCILVSLPIFKVYPKVQPFMTSRSTQTRISLFVSSVIP